MSFFIYAYNNFSFFKTFVCFFKVFRYKNGANCRICNKAILMFFWMLNMRYAWHVLIVFFIFTSLVHLCLLKMLVFILIFTSKKHSDGLLCFSWFLNSDLKKDTFYLLSSCARCYMPFLKTEIYALNIKH